MFQCLLVSKSSAFLVCLWLWKSFWKFQISNIIKVRLRRRSSDSGFKSRFWPIRSQNDSGLNSDISGSLRLRSPTLRLEGPTLRLYSLPGNLKSLHRTNSTFFDISAAKSTKFLNSSTILFHGAFCKINACDFLSKKFSFE